MGGKKKRLDVQSDTCIEQFNHCLLPKCSIFLNVSTNMKAWEQD